MHAAAVVTPFDDSTGRINAAVLPKYIKMLEKQDLDGIFVGSTSGKHAT